MLISDEKLVNEKGKKKDRMVSSEPSSRLVEAHCFTTSGP